MKAKIKFKDEIMDVTIEMVDGVMVVTPKNVDKEEVDYSQFKDGDIVADKDGFGICIYKGRMHYSRTYVDFYCGCKNLDNSLIVKYDTDANWGTIDEKRFATEEEKQKLFDALAKEGKMWDAEKKAVVDLKWKPNDGAYYYAPNIDKFCKCSVDLFVWIGANYDVVRYNKGWAFPETNVGRRECQALCDKLNEAINSIKP